MKHFLYYLSLNPSHQDPADWTEADHAALQGHLEFLDRLGAEGRLVFAGRTDMPFGDEMLFGIALILAGSQEDAELLMAGDPAVVQGIQSARVLPYRLAVNYFGNAGESA